MRKKIVLVAVATLAVLSLVGASLTYAALNKTVTLSVDGEAKQIETFGGTVEEVLKAEGIDLGERDAVAPAPSTSVSDGTRIAVRFARQLTLTVDGEENDYWVTATDVDEALGQIGMRFANADLSASRSQPIGRDGLELEVKTEKNLKLVVKGKQRTVTTTALTVREALNELDIGFDGNDELTPRPRAQLDNGSRIKLVRIKTVKRSEKVSIDNNTVVRENDEMYEDQENVKREGRDGVRKVTYRVVLADGKERSRKVVNSTVLRKPVARVEVHGTQERETA